MKKITVYGILVCCMVFAGLCFGQDGTAVQPQSESVSLWDTIASGGIIGYVIICLSLCATALIIEFFLSTRMSVLMPDQAIDSLTDLISNKKTIDAYNFCEQSDTFLNRIVASALRMAMNDFDFAEVEKAAEQAARRESGLLYRKLEYINFITVSTPMLGLLGTVTGMISAFNHIAIIDGAARSSQLASAISQALVTTCLGLIVAIITLFFLSVFRNRIEQIMSEAEVAVEIILHPLKQ